MVWLSQTRTSAAILAALLLTGCGATAPPVSPPNPAAVNYGTFGNADTYDQAKGWCEVIFLDDTSLQACYDAARAHCLTYDGTYTQNACKEGG